jgi:hypothetical protein
MVRTSSLWPSRKGIRRADVTAALAKFVTEFIYRQYTDRVVYVRVLL